MITIVAAILLGQVSPGPLDAFRANFASIRADVDFVYEHGHADSATIEGDRLWAGQVVGFEEHPARGAIGRWSYDGKLERYEISTPPSALQDARRRRGDGEIQPYRREPFELIYDGVRAAYHTIDGKSTDPRSRILVYHARLREPHHRPARSRPSSSSHSRGRPTIGHRLYQPA